VIVIFSKCCVCEIVLEKVTDLQAKDRERTWPKLEDPTPGKNVSSSNLRMPSKPALFG
jgi:hypothetical protein